MEVLNLATLEKQDEILSNFPISGGTDWSKYIPLNENANVPQGTVYDSFTNLLTVLGKGYVSYIRVNVPYRNISGGYPAYGKYRIKIDDDIVIEGLVCGERSEGYGAGIGSRDGERNVISVNNRDVRQYGYISEEEIGSDKRNDIIYLNSPLFFKQKLEVDFVGGVSNSTSGGIGEVRGGIAK